MLIYLLQVTLCWGVFYLLYALLLSRETFFRINRWYLLSTLLLGLLIPTMDVQSFFWTESRPIVVPLEDLYASAHAIEQTAQVRSESTWWDVLFLLYQVGAFLFVLRFGHGLWKIYQLYRSGTSERQGNIHIVYTETEHLPFSFFNYLFWSKKTQAKYDEQQQILRHEEAHISGWHTLDVLLMEVLGILFWCSPMIYLYRASMRNVHEYLADAWVLQTTTKKTYGRLLLQQSLSGFQIALANNFINSQLKKRIIMMTRNHSTKMSMTKYLWVLPILVLAVLVFSKYDRFPTNKTVVTASLSSEAAYEQATQGILNNDPIHKVVDEMPRFPGCEDKEGEVRKECSQMELLQFIYTKIKYPEAARNAGIQGTAVVSFVVEKDGSITELKMLRSPGEGTFDEEVLRVTGAMPKWIPGKHQGEIVRVEFKLPVKFKLEDDSDTAPISEEQADENGVFKVVDEMPRFPGCEELAAEARKECSQTKLLEFIYTNITYPAAGREAGIQGTSVVRFVIAADGTVSSPEVKRSIGADFDETILEVVAQMPKWIPGKQDGEAVAVQFHLPVKFKLEDDAAEQPNIKNNYEIKFEDYEHFTISIIQNDKIITQHDLGSPVLAKQQMLQLLKEIEHRDLNLSGKDKTLNIEIIQYDLVQDLSTQKQDLVIQDLRIAPNPSSGNFDLSFSAAAVPTQVQVLTTDGRIVFRWDLSNFDGQVNDVIKLKNPANGTYYLRIIQGDKVHIEPIVIQK